MTQEQQNSEMPTEVSTEFTADEKLQFMRRVEALIFASVRPLSAEELKTFFPPTLDIAAILEDIQSQYAGRGFELVNVADKWSFRTASDLAPYLQKDRHVPRKLSRATVETLAIIAYHQPVTRAEIEDIRGVSVSQGTIDLLLEAGWLKPGRRRDTPGRPLTWVTTEEFLSHFGLAGLDALPGFDELKASGLLDKNRQSVLPLASSDDLPEAANDDETDLATAEEL